MVYKKLGRAILALCTIFVLLPGLVLPQVASANPDPGWYDASWPYRKAITIDHTNVSNTDQSNFPVLISRTDTDCKDIANGGHVAQADGGDILFTSADGTTKLSHEIENYTPSIGELITWVKVPTLFASANTVIYVYYGNAACANQWASAGSTWDSNFKMVQHLKETSGTHYDSTSNANNGTPNGGVTQGVAGTIDGANTFDGSNDYIQTSLARLPGTFTAEAWVNRVGAANQTVLGTSFSDNAGRNHSSLYVGDYVDFDYDSYPNGNSHSYRTANGTVALNHWQHIVVSYTFGDYNSMKMYVNGLPVAGSWDMQQGNPTHTSNGAGLRIGALLVSGWPIYYEGSIDEVRVSDVARSADWIKTEYNNQSSPNTFYTVGAENAFIPPGQRTIEFDCGIDTTGFGPWMYDAYDDTPYVHNLNPDKGVYAYASIVWNTEPRGTGQCDSVDGSGTLSYGNCTAENTNVQDGINGVTLEFSNYSLAGLQKINWGQEGQSFDRRNYTGGTGTIKVGGDPKLKIINSRITMDVQWTPPAGNDGGITGSGWGTIDKPNSDDAWEAEFDNGNGQVEFVFGSFSPVIQTCWGFFANHVTVKGAPNIENMQILPINAAGAVNFPEAKISLNVASFTKGGPLQDQDSFLARQVLADPGGTPPAGIDNIITYCYWELATVLDAIDTSVTFDLTDIPGITDPNLLSILKREDASHAWEIYPDQTLEDATHIRANGVTSFSEFGLGVVVLAAYAGPDWYVSPYGDDTLGDGSEDFPFRTIQHTIDQASNGHIIKVMDDNNEATDDYVENITVDKSLTIERYNDTGANPQVKAANATSDVFNVTASNVTIRGLDVYGATAETGATGNSGIHLASSANGCTISGNRCGYDSSHYNGCGIKLGASSNSNSTISGNTSSNNLNHGIYLDSSDNNTISGNTCSSNGNVGIYVTDFSSNNTISGNTCSSNLSGIRLGFSSNNNTISGNICNSNSIGIYMYYSSNNNTIYLNSFSSTDNVDSTNSANTWQSPTRLAYKFNGQTFKSFMGNYYSDYSGADASSDGIGDTSFATDGAGDSYPLMQQRTSYELQTWYLSNPTMYKNDVTKSGGTVNIAASGNVIWKADAPVDSEMTFPWGMMADDTSWTGQVAFETAPATDDNFTVQIGYSTDGIDFTTGGAQALLNGDGAKTTFTYTTNSAAITVPNGKYLALRITNNSPRDYSVRIGGSWGYVSAPVEEAPPAVEIAFATGRDSDLEIYTMETDGDNQTRRTTSAGYDNHPALSPDGNKIAFVSTRNGNRDIYVMNKDGSGLTQLTTDPGGDIWPAWSPNGNKIVFASSRDGALNIYKMDSADGANQTRLTTDPSQDLMPAWSPNGNKIAFVSYRDGDSEIFIMDTDGQNQTKLTDNTTSDLWPAWSPDSTKLVFNSDRNSNTDIYIMDASNGADQTPLTSDPAIDYQPYFLPDGSKIIFTTMRNGNPDIYSMDTDGNNQAQLTTSTQGDWSRGYWVSPVVTTQDASNRGTDAARLNANLTNMGSAGKIAAAFQWGTSPGVYTNETPMQTLTELGTFYADIGSLDPETPYYFRVKTFGDGYAFGLEKTFNTLAGPATRHVGTGQAYATIQAAVDVSSDGDTIIVHDGTYIENVDVNKQVVIQSQNGPSTTKVEAASDSDHVFDVTVNNVTIKGFKIYGTGVTSERAGVMLNQVTGCLIDNNFCGVDSSRDNDYGILLFRSSNNQVTGNHCIDDNEGIALQGSDNNTIKDNTIRYSDYYDIHLEDSPSGNGSDSNIIRGNTCSDSVHTGIYVVRSTLNEIYGNAVSYEFSNGIELWNSSNNIIHHNTLSHMLSFNGAALKIGFASYPSNGNTIYLNDFIDNDTNVLSEGSTNVWHSPEPITYDYTAGSVHTSYLGNYYSDYNGADDGSNGRTANDGVGDTAIPVTTDGNNDSYPLMAAASHYTGVTTYTLTISVVGSGITDPSSGTAHTYAAGETVSIIATPAGGWRWVNWTGDVSTVTDVDNPTTTIVMNGDYSITANFIQVSPGDANGDGNLNALDITKVERIIAGLDLETPGADANEDGHVNALDITKTERLIAGLDIA